MSQTSKNMHCKDPLYKTKPSPPLRPRLVVRLNPIVEVQEEVKCGAESTQKTVRTIIGKHASTHIEEDNPAPIRRSLSISIAPRMPLDSVVSKVPNNSPVEQSKKPTEAKGDDDRKAWCDRYDAAQPSGRSLSVNDPEYQILVSNYKNETTRNTQTAEKKEIVKQETAVNGSEVQEEEEEKGMKEEKDRKRKRWFKLFHF